MSDGIFANIKKPLKKKKINFSLNKRAIADLEVFEDRGCLGAS
jgi:hypothetical protein